jgi:hypothetical protein
MAPCWDPKKRVCEVIPVPTPSSSTVSALDDGVGGSYVEAAKHFAPTGVADGGFVR